MKEVFISYSTIDLENAETVRNVLEKNGISCWMAPRDIPGGSNYTKEIPIAIRNCKIFVLILSKNAQKSQWVLKELDSAVNHGKVVLPFMLEDFILNDEFNFLLTGAQRYAAYKKKTEIMETFINRIKSILAVSYDGSFKEEQSFQEEKESDSKTKKGDTLVLEGAVCPACGTLDVKHLPERVKRSGAFELLTMLICVPLAIFGSFLFLFFSDIFFLIAFDDLALPFFLIGGILGAIGGDCISKTIVKRRRIRKKLPDKCYRCNECKKVFLGYKKR